MDIRPIYAYRNIAIEMSILCRYMWPKHLALAPLSNHLAEVYGIDVLSVAQYCLKGCYLEDIPSWMINRYFSNLLNAYLYRWSIYMIVYLCCGQQYTAYKSKYTPLMDSVEFNYIFMFFRAMEFPWLFIRYIVRGWTRSKQVVNCCIVYTLYSVIRYLNCWANDSSLFKLAKRWFQSKDKHIETWPSNT